MTQEERTQGKLFIEKVRNAIENAHSSIDLLLSWRRYSNGIIDTFIESIEKAWEKNVKTRFLVESVLNNKTASQIIDMCRKPFSEIRVISHCPRTVFVIYDKREISLVINPEEDLKSYPALWSSNNSLIALAEELFQVLWLASPEVKYLNPL